MAIVSRLARSALPTTALILLLAPAVHAAASYPTTTCVGAKLRAASMQCRAVFRAWSTDKFVTAVCHGPCALLGVKLGDGTPFVRGKKLTSFSKAEEFDYAREDVPYELQDALVAEGAEYSSTSNWQTKVVVDGRLITGQNPASAGALAKELLAALKRVA